ncbi:type 1 glutamine amidotransferase domain-containing protein [Kibdelosporangium phytohabitans]|uniref:Thiamine biosynthesis protein ThiJ n=1 Tax=Kibdelosporangium phytohabitans TaxID=860235 RepID=A0A0N9I975_9PSEU|nr:type 1 glutamine amidotransferase domain-containing protein [Kibdelosporangium phytohabitans]ALG14958.1 thiamine biosynthesis protein ThiJ [Kibdelosporangium phytohabitans]MBE1469574.1 putative intracellular protease/amidase [Kibdelosporangium phytohabitans]
MSKKILFILSEYGYWGEELLGPLVACDEWGYQPVFATPTGKRPHALPPSLDPGYVDPPLGRTVTTAEVAVAARELDESTRLDQPLSLAGWLPERPYLSDAGHLRRLESYHRELAEVDEDIAGYDALVIVGGSGPIVDLANNGRVHDLVLAFVRADKPIVAECYGVACLAFARDWDDRRSVLRSKHVTGHPKEYDYKDGTGFLGTDFVIGPPPYPLEYILRDATAPDGFFHGNVGRDTSVLVDYPFITARSTPDSFLAGRKLIEVLESGLRRFGW